MTGNRRGLTAIGAALVVIIIGGLGAVASVLVSGSLGIVFAVAFVLGCVLAALRTHPDDLIGVVIMPPLVYALITIGVGFLHPTSGGDGGGLRTKAIDIGSELILRAPSLLVAELLVVLIAIIRARRATIARRERERARARAAAARRDPRPSR